MSKINGYELLSEFKFQSNYSKYNEENNRRETWEESVDRVFDQMHGKKFKHLLETNEKFKEYYDFAIKKYKEKKVLGSQRALQFGGDPILKHNAKIFNCTVSYCDRLKFFQEAMYMLLCGCGVGFSVQNKHIKKLPTIKKRSNRSKVFVIEDSIEGWSDAIGVLISSYFDGEVPFPKYQNCHVSFDYSQIRPKGSHISGGFKAPGHEGLRNSIQKIEELLEKELDKPNFDGTVKSIIAYDIVMHMSDAVLSGGVRRSATICMFSPDDNDMLNAKTGNWFIKNPQRARSNNTVLLNRDNITKEEFHKYFESIKQYGEPGFGFTDNEDIIYNPCVTKDTTVLTTNGYKKVEELIDKKFTAIVNGDNYQSLSNGFFFNGNKEVYKLTTKNNKYTLRLTDNHKLLIKRNNTDTWVELKNINIGDTIILNKRDGHYNDINIDIVESIIEDGVEDVYDCTIENVHCFEANGILAHNCFEIGMRPLDKNNVSGWECCNLTEINGNSCTSEEEFYENCKAASFIGTLQATYTDFKYLGPESKEICDTEALLGVSITGFMNNPDVLLNPDVQKKGAQIVKKINKETAEMLGINQAARTTCVKPSGNASVLLGTASGIHGEHSKNYVRNVQVNKEDDVAKFLREKNPKMFEDSVWSANKTDWVVSFPIEANKNSIYKDQLNGVNLLKYVKLTQQNWVEEGTNPELCTDKTMRHNVSNTVVVDDWNAVEDYIFENRKWFSGVSLLPMTGDKDYNQAPFISILTAKELVKKYGDAAMFASGLIVDGLNAFNNDLWLACDTTNGVGEKLEYTENEVAEELKMLTPRECWENLGFKNGTLETLVNIKIKPEVEEYKRYMDSTLVGSIHNYALKKDWVRRAKQFADRYFNSIKEMTYCLKDVHNYHKWIEINRDVEDVDWKKLNLKPSYTDIDTTGAVACSGGACEI